MKIALEIERGLTACCPDHILESLAKIAESEGADRSAWLDEIAKAAGAVQTTAPAAEKPRYAILSAAKDEAVEIYETGITLAMAEIYELLKDAASKADKESVRKTATSRR